MFAHGTLTASMAAARPDERGLALGAWGAAQATSAGLAIAFSGIVNDFGSSLAVAGRFGETLAVPSPATRSSTPSKSRCSLATLVAIGPLVRSSRQPTQRRRAFHPDSWFKPWRTTMIRGAIGNLDVAQIVLYAFFAFFTALIWYLRREDRREGYPLESEAARRVQGARLSADPVAEDLPSRRGGVAQRPDYAARRSPVKAAKVEPWPGAPLQPTRRSDARRGRPRRLQRNAPSRPLQDDAWRGSDFAAAHSAISRSRRWRNPIGFSVVGADHTSVGVDQSMFGSIAPKSHRALSTKCSSPAPSRRVLLPVYFAASSRSAAASWSRRCSPNSSSNVPALGTPDRVTMLEEDRIAAYYGAGTLYATT